MLHLNIALIGDTNSGKSNLLNALAGCWVACTSCMKETHQIEVFKFSKNGKIEDCEKLTAKLKDIHNSNQVKHNNMNKLKIEDISTCIIRTNATGLPVPYGLDRFHIWDFPGLNIDTNNGQIYEKLFANRVSNNNLVIYVTDIMTGFQKKSEMDMYGRIKDMVDAKNKNGYYTKLIIVVNKYDTFENHIEGNELDDISIIFKAIKDKGFSEPIFRISSHKLMISHIIENGHMVKIPQYHKQIAGIIKNAEYYYDEPFENYVMDPKKLAKWYNNNDIQPDYNHEGDWDNLIGFIHGEQKNIAKNMVDKIYEKLKRFLFPTGTSVRPPYIIEPELHYNFKVIEFSKQYIKIWEYIKKFQIDDQLFVGYTIKYYNMMIDKTKWLCFSMMYFLYCKNVKHNTIPMTILKSFDSGITRQKRWLFYFYQDMIYEYDPMKYNQLFIKLLGDPSTYKCNGIKFYCFSDGKKCNIKRHYNNECKCGNSSFLCRILSKNPNNDLIQLHTLATKSNDELKIMNSQGILPYDLIEKYMGQMRVLLIKGICMDMFKWDPVDEVPVLFTDKYDTIDGVPISLTHYYDKIMREPIGTDQK